MGLFMLIGALVGAIIATGVINYKINALAERVQTYRQMGFKSELKLRPSAMISLAGFWIALGAVAGAIAFTFI